MLSYHFKLALLNIRHHKILAGLLVLLIAIGVGSVMTMLTMIHNIGADPIPRKSHRLHVVQMDNQEADGDTVTDQTDLPERLTYRDAMHLLDQSDEATSVVALFTTSFGMETGTPDSRPYHRQAVATTVGFFRMFDVPFRYGGPWSEADDRVGAQSIVIDQALNDRLFGGGNSVGRTIDLGSVNATVVGVLGEWLPNTRYYDSSMSPTALHQAFVPFQFALSANFARSDNPMSCWERDETQEEAFATVDVEGLKNSECTFVNLWVELADAQSRERYQNLVNSYIDGQRAFGRFPRDTTSFVTALPEWMVINKAVRPQFKMFLIVTVLLLVICLTNIVSLVLARLMGKAGEMSVRRALGASRLNLMGQSLIEVGMIASLGAVLALGLAHLGLVGMRALMTIVIGNSSPIFDRAFELNWTMAAAALGIAVVSTLLASILPVYSVCRAPPAFNLKT